MKFTKSITCICCGKKFWNYGYINHRKGSQDPRRESLCLECSKWLNIINDKPEHLEVIEGIAYKFNPMAKKGFGKILGNGGEHKYILHKDGTASESNDIWTIGKVPEIFRNRLPDTAWWLPNQKYAKRLLKGHFVCEGSFCYDRYRCLRYNYKQEFTKGPANYIPLTWKIGREGCTSFVDILSIQNYFDYYDIEDVIFDNKKQDINH